jgi:hypothetical protein
MVWRRKALTGLCTAFINLEKEKQITVLPPTPLGFSPGCASRKLQLLIMAEFEICQGQAALSLANPSGWCECLGLLCL